MCTPRIRFAVLSFAICGLLPSTLHAGPPSIVVIMADDLGYSDLGYFIAEAVAGEKPFFLYVSHYAPHWPLHAKPGDMAKYRDLYRKLGWDEARSHRYQRLVELGLIDAECGKLPA